MKNKEKKPKKTKKSAFALDSDALKKFD